MRHRTKRAKGAEERFPNKNAGDVRKAMNSPTDAVRNSRKRSACGVFDNGNACDVMHAAEAEKSERRSSNSKQSQAEPSHLTTSRAEPSQVKPSKLHEDESKDEAPEDEIEEEDETKVEDEAEDKDPEDEAEDKVLKVKA